MWLTLMYGGQVGGVVRWGMQWCIGDSIHWKVPTWTTWWEPRPAEKNLGKQNGQIWTCTHRAPVAYCCQKCRPVFGAKNVKFLSWTTNIDFVSYNTVQHQEGLNIGGRALGNLWQRNSLLLRRCWSPKGEVQRWPSLKNLAQSIFSRLMEGIFRRCEFKCNCALPNGGYIHQMRRLSHTKDFSGAAAWCRGYFQQGEREWNRKISIAGVTWHLDAQPNGMLWIFARCVCRRMGTEIGRDQLLRSSA